MTSPGGPRSSNSAPQTHLCAPTADGCAVRPNLASASSRATVSCSTALRTVAGAKPLGRPATHATLPVECRRNQSSILRRDGRGTLRRSGESRALCPWALCPWALFLPPVSVPRPAGSPTLVYHAVGCEDHFPALESLLHLSMGLATLHATYHPSPRLIVELLIGSLPPALAMYRIAGMLMYQVYRTAWPCFTPSQA